MSNVYKFCSCNACRQGKSTGRNKVDSAVVAKTFRRLTKAALKNGQEPPTKISFGRTD